MQDESKFSLYWLVAVVLLFVIGRFVGPGLFDNNWSFTHWHHLSTLYVVGWFVCFAVVTFILWRWQGALGSLLSSRMGALIGMAALLGLTIVFQFDSFVFGDGNLRVAQIAQSERILIHWFEPGVILVTSWLFAMFKAFGMTDNVAGVFAWRTLTYLATALTLIGAAKLAGAMVTDRGHRLMVFLMLFFGGQTLLYFGYVGAEPVVIPVCIWFAYFAYRALKGQGGALISAWLVVIVGVLLHFSLIFLVPAVLYITIAILFTRQGQSWLGFLVATIGYLVLLVLIYARVSGSLEYSKYLLFFQGKLPFADYGIFSGRHIGDLLQVLFLAAPLVLVMKAFSFTSLKSILEDRAIMAGWWMALGGTTVIVILDPVSNIVMDFPRLTAYLAPYSFLLALLAVKGYSSVQRPRLWLTLLTAAAIFVPLSYLPVYTSIDRSQDYAAEYFEKNDNYAYRTCLAYRDAYFYRGQRAHSQEGIDKANAWEWKLPTASPDYLNLRGCQDLMRSDRTEDAIKVLYTMVAKSPRWTEPRVALIAAQMSKGRYQLAKPQIDTCLMIEPYNKEHHILLYSYYRNTGNVARALQEVNRSLELFPGEIEMLTDKMLLHFGSGDVRTADSLATVLLTQDENLPYPYLVRGMIGERQQQKQTAIVMYGKFVDLAPEAAETPMIQQKLDSLKILPGGN